EVGRRDRARVGIPHAGLGARVVRGGTGAGGRGDATAGGGIPRSRVRLEPETCLGDRGTRRAWNVGTACRGIPLERGHGHSHRDDECRREGAGYVRLGRDRGIGRFVADLRRERRGGGRGGGGRGGGGGGGGGT